MVGAAIQDRPAEVRAASPVTYAHRSSPPVLLLHGRLARADPLVPHDQSLLLYRALRDSGAPVTFYSVPHAGHDWQAVLDPANNDGHTVHRVHAGTGRVTGGPAPG